jgi:7-cyano-7-deazaguanine synthase
MKTIKKAVVLCSGGLDSSTILALALKENYECHTLAFDYGQRHKSEIIAAKNISESLGAADHKMIKLDLRAIGGSALTDDLIDVPQEMGEGIPVTYVPARNTVFLSIALGYAEVIQAESIFIGVNAVDYSGYPDCRPEYIEAFSKMAALATKGGVEGRPVEIKTPLINLSKSEIVMLGTELGVDYSKTVSCYQANEHGKACGCCDSCRLRKEGFISAGLSDPTNYSVSR